MVGHLFQNYDTIYLRFFATYARKKPIYVRYKQAGAYGVTESGCIRGTELYRQQKTPHVRWIELKSNFTLNQAWPQ